MFGSSLGYRDLAPEVSKSIPGVGHFCAPVFVHLEKPTGEYTWLSGETVRILSWKIGGAGLVRISGWY